MIFSPSAIKKIKAGEKTATTRASDYAAKSKGLIAIQPGYGRKAVGWIRLKKPCQKIFRPLDGDAFLRLRQHAQRYYREEGFPSGYELMNRFLELKLDKALKIKGVLYFFEFEYVGEEKPPTPRKRRKEK